MVECHFLTRVQSLSRVISRPWKLVKQSKPLTSSHCTLTFLQACSAAFWFRSPSEISKTRPRRESAGIFCPAALLHGVIVGAATSKFDGTLTLYHSFLMKGWATFFF